jgi:hypothetical protein
MNRFPFASLAKGMLKLAEKGGVAIVNLRLCRAAGQAW